MSAYGIEYLDDAMRNLGEMTDYAVNACGMDLEDFWKLFLTTGFFKVPLRNSSSLMIA